MFPEARVTGREMTEGRAYDPTIYRGSAVHYARGRPAYSAELASTLASEVLLDGRGRLLDVGCGSGTLINPLAEFFSAAVGLDPDADMLAEASRLAREAGVRNVQWLEARAEDIPLLDLGVFRLVTFGHPPQHLVASLWRTGRGARNWRFAARCSARRQRRRAVWPPSCGIEKRMRNCARSAGPVT